MYQEKRLKFSTEVNESQVYNILTKNYIEIITDYFELQRIWLNNAYITFKDLDKYFILSSRSARRAATSNFRVSMSLSVVDASGASV